MNSSDGLAVTVWTPTGECETGVLRVKADGLTIRLDSGGLLSNQSSRNIRYRPKGTSREIERMIHFDPILITIRPYAKGMDLVTEDVFPPSTTGFYGRMRKGKSNAVYVIQEIEDDTRRWLLIGDPVTGQIFESQVIQLYEAEAIDLIDNKEHDIRWDNLLAEETEEYGKAVLSVLSDDSPSWEKLSDLISDITIPNLKIGKSMADTLSQFIPESFPDSTRKELMAFLAHVSKSKIQLEDPIEFLFRTYSLQIFGNLIRGHQRCVVDKTPWPSYVKLLRMAERRELQQPKVTLEAYAVDSPWIVFKQKMNESFPNWMNIAVNTARKLNSSRKIAIKLPATASHARKSVKKWKERLAALTYGLRIRGHVNASCIGLSELVYLGAAYRWPHRHMRFIAKLGAGVNPPHIQVMAMPKTAAERVKRFLPNITEVAWSTRTVNLGLFDDESRSWEIPVERILNSVDRTGSMNRLVKRFGKNANVDTYQMSKDAARVAGLVSRGIYLVGFEKEGYFKYWGLSRRRVQTILSDLRERGVVDITYEIEEPQLVSIAIIVQGEAKNVISLIESFLDYTPTSLVMLNKEASMGVILSTLIEDSAYEIVSHLPAQGFNSGMTVRCMRPTAFRSFTFDLYHRLLRDDNTWDDDVSAFLSQARSMRRKLSESNA